VFAIPILFATDVGMSGLVGSGVEPMRRVDPCMALSVLSPEAEGVIPYEQKERLEASARIRNSFNDPWEVIRSSDQGAQP
jgi:hypothetical protein